MWKFSLFCLAFIQNVFPMVFQDFKTEMEDLTMLLATRMEQFYSDWCQNGIASCETLTYNGCRGIRAKHCDTGFQTPSSCFTEGAFVSSASSISSPKQMTANNLSKDDIRFICSSAKLEKTFQQLNKIRDQRFSYMYAGSKQGLFRLFPGQLLDSDGESCFQGYDPRTRPWYTIAASGAKNVIILLDNSKSTLTKEENIRFAALSMLDTLSVSDNVGVIAFSDLVNVVSPSDNIMKVTPENINKIKQQINKVKFLDEKPDLESAFIKGIQIVHYSLLNGMSGCSQSETIFLLITSGESNFQPNNDPGSFINKIKGILSINQLGLKRLTLFIYSTGSQQNSEYLNKLSCAFNGTYLIKTQTTNNQQQSIITDLQHFYKYLSVSSHIIKPIWSSPYVDYFTGSEYMSVTIPVYHTQRKTGLSVLFGVVGVDVPTNQFSNFEFSKQSVINKLITQSPCQRSFHNPCTIEKLRYNYSRCGVENCIIEETNQTSCLQYPKFQQIFIQQDFNRKDRVCCGIKKVEFGLIFGGSTLFVIIVVILLWQRRKILKVCSRKVDYKQIKGQKRKMNYGKRSESWFSRSRTIKSDEVLKSREQIY